MGVPQYKLNVHLASILDSLGLPTHAEESFHVGPGGKRRIPDLVLNHNLAGAMLGEAEIGADAFDPRAREKLERRAKERFNDTTFKGFDFIVLIVYPERLVEKVSGLREAEVRRILIEEKVGLGLAARGEALGLKDHYVRWYGGEVRVVGIPQVVDSLVVELFRGLGGGGARGDVQGLVEGILSIIDNTARLLAANASGWVGSLEGVARSLGVAWDRIREESDRARITIKFILLLSTLIIIFYEIVRNERHPQLKPLDCSRLTFDVLADHLDILVGNRPGAPSRYEELDGNFTSTLRRVPAQMQLVNALRDLCREVKSGYVLIRRMGWDVLSMLYQRLLSETYRHAFATFYTKLPAARLLAMLAVERFEDSVIDPASGTGSLLLAALERRRTLLAGEALGKLLKRALETGRPLLDLASEEILRRTVGLDALKPALFIASLNLRIATHGSPPSRLRMYEVPVGADRAGSLDMLTGMRSRLPQEVRQLVGSGFDVVIMNPPFTRSDRISYLIGEDARRALSSANLSFGGVRVGDIFAAGLAKPFMVLADRLLKGGGKIAAVLPNSILSRPSWRDVRTGLVNGYRIKYIVVSWAPGTPNFSSDTLFREILLVAEKKGSPGGGAAGPVRIVNLYKPVDELGSDEIEAVARAASSARKGITNVRHGGEVIASIVSVDLEGELRRRLQARTAGKEGDTEALVREGVKRLAGNLYRLVAFRSPELLRMHLDIVLECSVPLGSIFQVGSVIDHTGGIIVVKRGAEAGLLHPAPALWGSGRRLNVKAPWLKVAPHTIGVASEDGVRIRYWRESGQTFYKARLFLPRRVQLDTQYVLMVRVGEDSVSNVWWPLRPLREGLTTRYLVYMNSVFGLINLLGERLETRGLYIELKKRHLREMPVPDLSPATPPREEVIGLLQGEMPRLDKYIKHMASQQETTKLPLDKLLETITREANSNTIDPITRRALIDREALRMLRQACPGIRIPQDLYTLLASEIQTLQKIMEHKGSEETIKDNPEKPEKKRKHRPLTNWM